jgi:solute carrier family 35 (UDP-xylose/UDP-N-acetylglucosamine transporter), member B4
MPFPFQRAITTAVLFFGITIASNMALGMHVPMPVLIIFRSGSLITTSLLNRIILGRRYRVSAYIAVIMITAGVIISTRTATKTSSEQSNTEGSSSNDMAIGIALLFTSLVSGSLLGIYQEVTYRKYGAHWRESLFYSVA